VLAKEFSSRSLASPKSAIFKEETPSSCEESNKFSGLISLCKIPYLWQYEIASTIALVASRASFSENYSFSSI